MKRQGNSSIATIAIFLSLFIGGNAFALVLGGSNFGLLGYPEHHCLKPTKPFEFRDEWEIENFKRDVSIYKDCVVEYLENADNDIRRIQEATEELINEANAPY